MTPLHYVEISLENAPAPPKRGAQMDLDRTLVLAMLDPASLYYAVEIARIAYVYEIQKAGLRKCHRHLLNARRAYAQLAALAGLGSNIALSGAQWLALVSDRQALAAFMQRLKQAMEQEPGVVFTYHENEIVPYPDQTISTAPFLAPQLTSKKSGKIIFQTIDQQAERDQADVKVPETSETPDIPTACLTPMSHTTGEKDQGVFLAEAGSHQPSLALKFAPHLICRWFLSRLRGVPSRVKLAVLTLMALVPSAYCIYWFNLDELNLIDIQEMGAPSNESPYFMAYGKRYEIGDRIHFEDQVGVIKFISRQRLAVGERIYEARPLIFFGCELEKSGNLVVYPGSPRKIAGNFWVKERSVLDRLPTGYLAWMGGYQNRLFARAELCEVLDFWELVTQNQTECQSEEEIALPPDTQFGDVLEQCGMKGAHISQTESYLEVSW